jgi:hypothetical protein
MPSTPGLSQQRCKTLNFAAARMARKADSGGDPEDSGDSDWHLLQ